MVYKPLVSIIIPVYNGANYMKEAIDSAINQTYENIEVIVVNDGSNDDGKTEEIAKSYAEKIRYVYKENGGVSSALNLGIKEMKGEYFSWLSHDDKYELDKIEKQITLLNKYDNQKNLIVLCGTQQIDKDSKNISTRMEKRLMKEDQIINYERVLKSLLNNGSFNGCALLIHKSIFKECGVFDENLRFCQDIFLWIKIFLKHYNLIYSNDKLVYSRIHDKQVTQTKRDLFHNDSVYISKKLINDFAKESKNRNNFYYLFAKYNAIHGISEIPLNYIKENKKFKKLSIIDICKLYIYILYGRIRPTIRKIYYKLILNVNTKK